MLNESLVFFDEIISDLFMTWRNTFTWNRYKCKSGKQIRNTLL